MVGSKLTNATGGAKSGYGGSEEASMIQCIRLWTGDDAKSHFEEGSIEPRVRPEWRLLTGKMPAASVSFEETARGGTLDWHTAPVRQLVITLSGVLDFETAPSSISS